MRWNYVICGLLILLVSSYIDSVRGPLLPVLNHALSLDYSQSSWFLIAGNFAAVFSTFLLLPLIHRYGSKAITIGICVLGGTGAASALVVTDFYGMLLLAVLLGSAIATAGAICNLLVFKGTDQVHRSRMLCGLHMMYGFGSFLAPTVAGNVLTAGFSWPTVVIVTVPFFAGLGLFAWLGFPREAGTSGAAPVHGRFTALQVLTIFTFVIYVAAEVLTSVWMVPYLVEVRKLGLLSATRYLSLFFLMMGLSRFLCFFSLKPQHESLVFSGALILYGVFFSLGHAGYGWALPLTGIVGPFFPLFLARVSRRFSEQAARLTLWIMACVQLGLAAAQFFVGRLADAWGLQKTYFLPLILMSLAFCLQWVYVRSEGQIKASAI